MVWYYNLNFCSYCSSGCSFMNMNLQKKKKKPLTRCSNLCYNLSQWKKYTYIFGWSQVEEQVIRYGSFNVKSNGVVSSFPDIRAVATETITAWWHWYFDLERGTRITTLPLCTCGNLEPCFSKLTQRVTRLEQIRKGNKCSKWWNESNYYIDMYSTIPVITSSTEEEVYKNQ